jgi:hypothetical protein
MSITGIQFSIDTSRRILKYTKISTPAVVLVIFLVAFITHGILTAPPSVDVEVHARLGPGGRPLPKRRQSSQQVKEAAKVRDFSPNVKLLFNWLGLFALMTFAANAVLIVLQTIINFREKWWPGQAAVVRAIASVFVVSSVLIIFLDLRCCILLRVGYHCGLPDRQQTISNNSTSLGLAHFSSVGTHHPWRNPFDLYCSAPRACRWRSPRRQVADKYHSLGGA